METEEGAMIDQGFVRNLWKVLLGSFMFDSYKEEVINNEVFFVFKNTFVSCKMVEN